MAASEDEVVKEASLPLRGAKPSILAEALQVPDELGGESAKEASLPAVVVADEAVTDACSRKGHRCV